MAWCRASSLTAEVARTLRGEKFPLRKERILELLDGKQTDGLDIQSLLSKSLTHRRYPDLRSVMRELEDWLNVQG